MTIGLALGGVSFLAFLILQVGLAHLPRDPNRARITVRLFVPVVFLGAGSASGVAVATGRSNAIAAVVLSTIFTAASLFVVYMPFYYVIATSLSVDTLILLEESQRQHSTAGLYDRYSSEAFLQPRLNRMATSGLLTRDGSAYRLTPKGEMLATVFHALKRLWRLGPGG